MIHEQGHGYVTLCELPIVPLTQTTHRWAGEGASGRTKGDSVFHPILPGQGLPRNYKPTPAAILAWSGFETPTRERIWLDKAGQPCILATDGEVVGYSGSGPPFEIAIQLHNSDRTIIRADVPWPLDEDGWQRHPPTDAQRERWPGEDDWEWRDARAFAYTHQFSAWSRWSAREIVSQWQPGDRCKPVEV